nr:hypothetical protein [Micromonospora sp. DSM 115978]
MRDLGTLGGTNSAAVALNALGQTVGWSTLPNGARHATLWSWGSKIDLGTLGGQHSEATDINDSGWVVGYSDTADGTLHAFAWVRGHMYDLGVLSGDTASVAVAVNNNGQIIGNSYD